MLFLLIGAGLVLVALLLIWQFVFHQANPALKSGEVKIRDAIFSVEVASTTLEQARGLSFRPSLPENQGMLFVFGTSSVQNFWMKDMHFPLDMIWIGGNKIVGFVQNAVPEPDKAIWSLKIYTSPDGVDKVLEVNAGTVLQDNIQVGDLVQIGEAH